jgi:hypothetical protein
VYLQLHNPSSAPDTVAYGRYAVQSCVFPHKSRVNFFRASANKANHSHVVLGPSRTEPVGASCRPAFRYSGSHSLHDAHDILLVAALVEPASSRRRCRHSAHLSLSRSRALVGVERLTHHVLRHQDCASLPAGIRKAAALSVKESHHSLLTTRLWTLPDLRLSPWRRGSTSSSVSM